MKNARPATGEELVSIAEQCEHPAVQGLLQDMGEGDPDDYEGNFMIVDGDCVVDGDFDTDTHELAVLIVRGNLTVAGYFRDRSDDAPTVTVILGDLRAKNVITAGLLEVTGQMKVEQAVVGDYNHGGALVHGGLTTDLFMPMEIEYEVRGDLQAREQIPGFTTSVDFVPQRLDGRFFTASEGKANLFSGEAGDRYVDAIAAGVSILAS